MVALRQLEDAANDASDYEPTLIAAGVRRRAHEQIGLSQRRLDAGAP